MGLKSSRMKSMTNEDAEKYAKVLNAPVEDIRKFEVHYRAFFYAEQGKKDKKSFVEWFGSFYARTTYYFQDKNNTNLFCEKLFDAFDVDNDGFLSFEEFLAGNVLLTCPDKKKSLEYIFQIIDINNNGTLDQSELERIFAAMRPFYEGQDDQFKISGAKEAEKFMKKLDTNNEGKISKEAFVTHLLNDPECSDFIEKFSIDNASVRPGRLYTDEPGRFLKFL